MVHNGVYIVTQILNKFSDSSIDAIFLLTVFHLTISAAQSVCRILVFIAE